MIKLFFDVTIKLLFELGIVLIAILGVISILWVWNKTNPKHFDKTLRKLAHYFK